MFAFSEVYSEVCCNDWKCNDTGETNEPQYVAVPEEVE